MKFGILTFHNIPNIGAILQAYSLCEKMRQLNQNCEIIDYYCENIARRELIYQPLKNPLKNFIIYHFVWPKTKRRIDACQQFMKQNNMISKQSYERASIQEANSKYDAFIAGSDMIWNLKITDYDYSYFLDFAIDDKKLFSYAASVGDVWNKNDMGNVAALLKQYDRLSVREEDTSILIQSELQINCQCVSDPTLLLGKQHWQSMVKRPKEENYVLVYFPYKEILTAAIEYANKRHKKVFIVNAGLPVRGTKNINIYEPAAWLSYICYADAIFTDSYHGLLFSFYFNKNVWTNNQSNRVLSLLSKLDVEDCLIERDRMCNNQIDYKKVNKKLDDMRNVSLKYLEEIIEETV